MPKLLPAAIAALLMITPVFAQDASAPPQETQTAQDTSQAPLAPGKPAGITDAQTMNTTIYWVAAGALVIAAIAIPLSGGGNGHSTTQTTQSRH